jgi:hypothetical protein
MAGFRRNLMSGLVVLAVTFLVLVLSAILLPPGDSSIGLHDAGAEAATGSVR